MTTRISKPTKTEAVEALRERYRQASKKENRSGSLSRHQGNVG
jgi:hypothetical protein